MRHTGRVHAFVGTATLGLTAVACALTLWAWHTPPPSPTARPAVAPGEGYGSSDGCRACHPSQYASWRASYHRTMTQVATADTVAPSFDDVRVEAVQGRPMTLHRRDQELWAEFDEPDWDGAGEAPPRITRKIAMTTGSHHQQLFWYETGHDRLLGQLPGIWLTDEQRWVPRRAAVMRPPGGATYAETGAWNAICLSCHATHARSRVSSPFRSEPLAQQGFDTRAAELGIACESCHGPAADHAAANRNPLGRYRAHLSGAAQPSVIQPERLDPRRASEVCGQCHSVWEFASGHDERLANQRGLPYRPGADLRADRFIVQPSLESASSLLQAFVAADAGFVRDVFWSDGMVRATGREYNGLIDSPCFANGTEPARTLTCFSCHQMHPAADDPRPLRTWANDQLGPGKDGNGACLQCHPTIAANESAHTRHAPGSTGSSCYNCHMPFTTYGLLKTVRSHQISSPSVQASQTTGRPNACNLCHLDKSLGWTSEHLQSWYGIAPPSLSADDQAVAASLVWLLRGDAGQRAIIAQSMGWKPARDASHAEWLAPYLALLLDDPYDAVRYIAGRSLRSLDGYGDLAYDYVAPQPQRNEVRVRALQMWRGTAVSAAARGNPQLLFRPDGSFQADTINRLTRERDQRRVLYRE